MNKIIIIIALQVLPTILIAQQQMVIKFEHIANGKIIVPQNDWYVENYRIDKLKYYISNINVVTETNKRFQKNVYLIDAAKNDKIILKIPKGKIVGLTFLVGVDSILNCSGAQQGALDPLNDMFWTWNNGYVFFKLDGVYSKDELSKLSYHIGGYKGAYKAQRQIYLPLQNQTMHTTIVLNIDKLWDCMPIKDTKLISSPGVLAKKVADNFTNMFTIKNEN